MRQIGHHIPGFGTSLIFYQSPNGLSQQAIMLKHIGRRIMLTSPLISPALPYLNPSLTNNRAIISTIRQGRQRGLTTWCGSRRRLRYEDENGSEEGYYGYNKEIAMLEMYTQSARGEALLVHALLDDQQVEVLIFKGFSSCLSNGTSPDPSKSVLPERAVISSIDRIRGPLDPSNIEYLEKGLSLESFKSRLPQS